MLHFIGKNSATLDYKPLTNYLRTFRQLEKKALAREEGVYSTLEDSDRKAMGIAEDLREMEQYGVLIFRQGSFTIACITFRGCPVSFGYAKRNVSHDVENPARSENIAIHRAISNCFVEEIKDLSKTPDSMVYIVEHGVMSQEEHEQFKKAVETPGEAFEVHRIQPIIPFNPEK